MYIELSHALVSDATLASKVGSKQTLAPSESHFSVLFSFLNFLNFDFLFLKSNAGRAIHALR